MKKLSIYLASMGFFASIFAIPWLIGGDYRWWYPLALGCVVGLAMRLEEDGVRLIWQSPRLFQCAGLYLKIGNKRYRVAKVGLR